MGMKKFIPSLLAVAIALVAASCEETTTTSDAPTPPPVTPPEQNDENTGATPAPPAPAGEKGAKLETITLGGGCFWCVEAVYERVEGVHDAVSGYMGGHVENPTYEQVCGKKTGHIEVVQVKFDPKKISLEEVLEIFWQAHDPTTKDRQGADVGPQYRSAIFYHNEAQKKASETSIKKLNESGYYDDKAVTELYELAKFWVAEDYHQDYYRLNGRTNGYCQMVIHPKIRKLEKKGMIEKK